MANKLIDLTGQKFGRLTILFRAKNDRRGFVKWACRCDCGRLVSKVGKSITCGNVSSCGCLHKERTKTRKGTHGGHNTRLYHIWCGMKSRCNYPKNNRYYTYGARGIRVCPEWNKSFVAFRDWALKNGYRDDLTLDRIDVNGNYCPENCRWATVKEQANNRRDNVIIVYEEKKYTIAQLAEKIGVNPKALYARLKKREKYVAV